LLYFYYHNPPCCLDKPVIVPINDAENYNPAAIAR